MLEYDKLLTHYISSSGILVSFQNRTEGIIIHLQLNQKKSWRTKPFIHRLKDWDTPLNNIICLGTSEFPFAISTPGRWNKTSWITFFIPLPVFKCIKKLNKYLLLWTFAVLTLGLRQDQLFLFDRYFLVRGFSEIIHKISHLNYCI